MVPSALRLDTAEKHRFRMPQGMLRGPQPTPRRALARCVSASVSRGARSRAYSRPCAIHVKLPQWRSRPIHGSSDQWRRRELLDPDDAELTRISLEEGLAHGVNGGNNARE
jgi:hypothetical protein